MNTYLKDLIHVCSETERQGNSMTPKIWIHTGLNLDFLGDRHRQNMSYKTSSHNQGKLESKL